MKIQLLGAALGAGARDTRTELAPSTLRQLGLQKILTDSGFSLEEFEILESGFRAAQNRTLPATLLSELPAIVEFNARLAQSVAEHLEKKRFPIVFGGDHSVAVGTWSGVAAHYAKEDLGLLWMDAHLDSHTPKSSDSGAVHGMPLAALLGQGDPRLSQIGTANAKFKPQNVCVLGVRSFETAEQELLKNLGVRVYHMSEIRSRGFETCFQEAYRKVTQMTTRFGMTLDLDFFDPLDVTAVGSPVPEGVTVNEFRSSLRLAARDPRLVAFELVEYNPALDPQQVTFLKIVLLLEELLWSRALGDSTSYTYGATGTLGRHTFLH